MRPQFLTKLRVEDLDGNTWLLLEPLVYVQDGRKYTVPAGFVTDLASVPRVAFWRPKSGPWNEAAVLHDAAYQDELEVLPAKTLTKADADALFRDAMQALGVGWWTRNVFYAAVRVGGGRYWQSSRQERV